MPAYIYEIPDQVICGTCGEAMSLWYHFGTPTFYKVRCENLGCIDYGTNYDVATTTKLTAPAL